MVSWQMLAAVQTSVINALCARFKRAPTAEESSISAEAPQRLQGEDIPLGARIIHVADALDSMLTTRIYRAARPANEALQETAT